MENFFETIEPLSFPPLFHAEPVSGNTDPFDKARTNATLGCDSGLLVHNVTPDRLRAAIVFAPEIPLEQAMAMLPTCGIGFQNALGALAPPEVAVQLAWTGDIILNGGKAGHLRAAASNNDASAIPDWLVIGLELQLIPRSENDPGLTPEQTSLFQEGCADVSPLRLLESWARHTLVWLNTFANDGPAALHAEWRGLSVGIGEATADGGTFVGIDENFGMLLRQGDNTRLLPLSSLLEESP
jgi:biotin-(acetyl-CoA carboxylase) ligase